jgi:hypothetical protein
MLVNLKKGVRINGQTYTKGQHSIPDELCRGWFFDGLVKDGVAEVLDRNNNVVEVAEPTMVDSIVDAIKDEAKKLVKRVRKSK